MGLICWIPNYLESEAGFPKTVALTTLTCMMAGTTATRLVLSRLRGPPRPAWLLAGGALLAAGYMLLTRTDAVLPLYGFGLLIGAAVGPHWPSLAAVVYAAAPRGHGALTGLFVLASTLGALLSMSAIGWFGDRFGLERALFAAVGSSCAFTGLYARLRQRAGSGPEPG
jgi:fucose permease